MPDYCTFWPDRLGGLDWSHCCALHDAGYDLGLDRAQVDADLYHCVVQATGLHWFAVLMFAAVSMFGWIFYKKKKGR